MGFRECMKGKLKAIIRLFEEKQIYSVPVQINTTELLKGKVALITGGSGGIGIAIAENFLKNGCKVIIAGTTEEKLEKCMKTLGGGTNLKAIVLNVNDINSLPDKIKEADQMFEERIDILVNSAGLVAKNDFFNMTEEEYDAIMDTNAKGTYFMSQAMAKYMIENGIKGHILNLSSSSSKRPAWTPYQMSKWAIRGLTLGLADALLPYGIIVNAIAPGPVATPMLGKSVEDDIYKADNPSGRYALPSEIAALATFMVSDMGNYIVGDTFFITGGSGTISLHK